MRLTSETSPAPASEPGIDVGLPVDWALARRTAARLVPAGPAVSRDDAVELVRRLRADAAVAEGHVRAVTGIGEGLPLLPADVVDRPAWAAAAHLRHGRTHRGRPPPAHPEGRPRRHRGARPGCSSAVCVAYLGGRVLGQYDPFGGADGQGRLLLVAPERLRRPAGAERAVRDFGHVGVPARGHPPAAVHRGALAARRTSPRRSARLLSLADGTRGGILERLPELFRIRGSGATRWRVVELLQGPEQRAVLDRLLALTTLLEGHADHVMDAAGPEVVPSVETIRARFTLRRRGGGLVDRLLRALLGVEAKVKQYAVGSAFTKYVVLRWGWTGSTGSGSAPETLPTPRRARRPRRLAAPASTSLTGFVASPGHEVQRSRACDRVP